MQSPRSPQPERGRKGASCGRPPPLGGSWPRLATSPERRWPGALGPGGAGAGLGSRPAAPEVAPWGGRRGFCEPWGRGRACLFKSRAPPRLAGARSLTKEQDVVDLSPNHREEMIVNFL